MTDISRWGEASRRATRGGRPATAAWKAAVSAALQPPAGSSARSDQQDDHEDDKPEAAYRIHATAHLTVRARVAVFDVAPSRGMRLPRIRTGRVVIVLVVHGSVVDVLVASTKRPAGAIGETEGAVVAAMPLARDVGPNVAHLLSRNGRRAAESRPERLSDLVPEVVHHHPVLAHGPLRDVAIVVDRAVLDAANVPVGRVVDAPVVVDAPLELGGAIV